MNPFYRIIGQSLISVTSTENMILNLSFNDYKLTIYNHYNLSNFESICTLINKKLLNISVVESKSFELIFEEELKIVVCLDDDSYRTPEAMLLEGPDNLIAVWQ